MNFCRQQSNKQVWGNSDKNPSHIIIMVSDSNFRTDSLTPGLTNNRFSHYQSTEENHAGWPDISAKVDRCVVNWYSIATEITYFSYFPKF